jgi:hypothetical protein
MSQSHEKPLDRLLRYSPWAAAVLVALCLVALVTRVAMYAGAADGPEQLASAAEIGQHLENETAVTSDRRQPESALSAVESGAVESRRSYDGLPSPSMTSEGGRVPLAQPTSGKPVTPGSKSRLQIYSTRTESVAEETAPPPKPANAQKNTATSAAIHAFSQPSRRATSLDGRVHTSFFGLEAYGRRFAYVLDRSGSMGEPDNKPLAAAKQELLTSLARLGDIHQFFIIFYNEEPAIFNPGGASRQAVFADEVTKNSARRFVQRVQAYGGTRHYDALAKAIALRPDVIFLLTDGELKDDLSDEELARLRRSNGGLAQIHVVQFAASPYEGNSLVQLATENRGAHTYKSLREITGSSAP